MCLKSPLSIELVKNKNSEPLVIPNLRPALVVADDASSATVILLDSEDFFYLVRISL